MNGTFAWILAPLSAVFNENEKQIHGERLCSQTIGKKL
jgi:hypothetical protein